MVLRQRLQGMLGNQQLSPPKRICCIPVFYTFQLQDPELPVVAGLFNSQWKWIDSGVFNVQDAVRRETVWEIREILHRNLTPEPVRGAYTPHHNP